MAWKVLNEQREILSDELAHLAGALLFWLRNISAIAIQNNLIVLCFRARLLFRRRRSRLDWLLSRGSVQNAPRRRERSPESMHGEGLLFWLRRTIKDPASTRNVSRRRDRKSAFAGFKPRATPDSLELFPRLLYMEGLTGLHLRVCECSCGSLNYYKALFVSPYR